MNERTRPTSENRAGSSGLGSIFDSEDQDHPLVTVSSGFHHERLPVGNTTVRAIRARFHDRFDIDPNSRAIIDGNEVGDDTVVRAGQALMFTNPVGEKGA